MAGCFSARIQAGAWRTVFEHAPRGVPRSGPNPRGASNQALAGALKARFDVVERGVSTELWYEPMIPAREELPAGSVNHRPDGTAEEGCRLPPAAGSFLCSLFGIESARTKSQSRNSVSWNDLAA